MKYAIYDKAADGYLTNMEKMEFDTGHTGNQMLTSTGYAEYITEARLLDTPKEAANAIVRIESCKFMNKGRFVMHSFDDTLKDQYIISEAGNPTKVVDNITVDLNGTINVKYGTMPLHWSATSLDYAVNRLNRLQDASAPQVYTAWRDTFDIYKVITVIDERECTHYQFIKVTEKGLDSAKEENTDSLNKRIEELEKVNSILTENIDYHNECRLALAEIIRSIKYAICSKDSDKRDNYVSYMTDRIKNDEIFNRPELKTTKNDIPKICKHLTALSTDSLSKRIEKLEKANHDLGEQVTARGVVANRLQDENDNLKAKDTDYEMLKNKLKACEVILESMHACLTATTKERDKALEQKRFYRIQANSVYGTTGNKILIDKEKYDDLVECVNNINITYEMLKYTVLTKDKPLWLDGIITRIKTLTI